MAIRPATFGDLSRIVEIYNAAIPGRLSTADLEPVSVDSRLPWFRAHERSHPLWVDQHDGTVAGWLGVQPFYGRCAYRTTVELSVYVAPERHRRGTGRALLDHLIRESEALGYRALVGFVFGHNEASLRLFAGAGFERWGVLPAVAQLEGLDRDLVIVGRHVGR
jgi:phosphinothricin acetyltransferase